MGKIATTFNDFYHRVPGGATPFSGMSKKKCVASGVFEGVSGVVSAGWAKS
jgi:hypothetical protein